MSTPEELPARWTGIVQAHANGGFVAYGDYLKLRTELEASRAALKKANSQAEEFERKWYLVGDELEASRLECERLRVDAASIDWLEQTEACDRWVIARMTAMLSEPDGFVVYRHGNKERGEGKTLRAALAAAMKKERT